MSSLPTGSGPKTAERGESAEGSALARSLRSIGAGVDGAAFAGEDEAGRPCTVHRVRLDAADPTRRRRLSRRLAFHEQALKEGQGSVLAVRAVALDRTPAIVVVERSAHTLADLPTLAGVTTGAAFMQAVKILLDLSRTLALAHAEGIVHGALTPKTVGLRSTANDGANDLDDALDDAVALSFLGLKTTTQNAPLDRALWPRDDDGEATSGDDAFAVGGLIVWLVSGEAAAIEQLSVGPREAATLAPSTAEHPLLLLARDLLDAEPAWRPTLSDAAQRLASLHAQLERTEAATAVEHVAPPPRVATDPAVAPKRLGRFLLGAELGAGAMGVVYRGVDEDSGAVVAIKILERSGPPSPKVLKRFRKEARLLAELQNPGIARFLAAGEENGQLYLVTELVEGQNLSQVLKARGPFAERDAVAIITDLLRALVDVHDNGIVHRDIKPENMIFLDAASSVAGSAADVRPGAARIKLIDFGIARHHDETASLAMTREGAVLGTPLYMAPEQVRGGVVDARTDIYAVGISLFELLIGRTPYSGKGVAVVLALQLEDVPPRAAELRPDVSDAVSRIVARALEKDPALRFQDARAMLQALEPLQDEPPEHLEQHPKVPDDAGAPRVWTFTWDLAATPAQLWPYVSNTERLNRAIGLGAVEESVVVKDEEVTSYGRGKQAGLALAWKENPFEWVFERRLGVVREYSEGPLRWYRSTVDLKPVTLPGGAVVTRLVHEIAVEPRGMLGRAAASVEVGVRVRRALDRTYHRIDDLVAGRGGDKDVKDAFEDPPRLPADKEARFIWLEKQAVAAGADAQTMARLGEWFRVAPEQEAGRLRPLALAQRFDLDVGATINACYYAASVGLLVPLWDLLCPTCRVPASIEETLKALHEHTRCEVCNISFALDLASSIELVFKLHPSLREADTATYCISSPAHTPHVMAQVRVTAGTTMVLDVDLPEGAYQLSGRGLPWTAAFRVRADAPKLSWQVPLLKGPGDEVSRAFAVGRQEFTLENNSGRDQLVRLERTTPRGDVLTAARALSSPVFKRLFPGEVLSPGSLVRVASVTLMIVDVRGRLADGVLSSEEGAFESLYGLYRAVDRQVIDCGGTVVKLQGEGVLAVFDEPATAVRCAAALPDVLRVLNKTAVVRCAVHRGSAGAVTLNDHVDYFGRAVREVLVLGAQAGAGELLLSDAVRGDPAVDALMQRLGISLINDGTLDDTGHRVQLPLSSP